MIMNPLQHGHRVTIALVAFALCAAAQAPAPGSLQGSRRQDLQRASQNYSQEPYGSERRPWVRGSSAEAPATISVTPPYNAISPPLLAPPPSVSLEHRVAERLLSAGLRGVLFLALIMLLAQTAPKRLWSEVVDGNNLALAIVLSAIAIALGIVISAP